MSSRVGEPKVGEYGKYTPFCVNESINFRGSRMLGYGTQPLDHVAYLFDPIEFRRGCPDIVPVIFVPSKTTPPFTITVEKPSAY